MISCLYTKSGTDVHSVRNLRENFLFHDKDNNNNKVN